MLIVFLSSCSFGPTCNHTFEVTSQTESTCSTHGIVIETCSLCNETKETKLPLTDHSFDAGVITNPTCTEEGYTIKTCSVCQKTEKVDIKDKIPHDYESQVTNPTCTEEGYTINKCKVCNHEEKVDIKDKIPHDYESQITNPTCTEEGFTTYTCNDCNDVVIKDYIDELGHLFSDWIITVNPTEVSDGLRARECSRCNYVEEEIIVSNSYVDLSVIKEEYDVTQTYDVASYEELLRKFNAALLTYDDILEINLLYDQDFNDLLNDLIKDASVPFSYNLSASLRGSELKLTIAYYDNPTTTTPNIAYTQYDSLNYQKQTYAIDHQFRIDDSIYTYEVATSEQLHYVLERGVKPICVPNSSADIIYQEIKKVLNSIISDEMTDLEKVTAIHDYLVMNVTYDNDLLEMLYAGNNNLKSYNGFYLEGVFFDKKAVCEGISKAFTAMCNMEGIPCVTVDGYQTQNPNGAGHAWNKVYLNGKWYIADATSDGTIINNSFEVLTYKYFLIKESQYQEKYTGEVYQNIICDSEINIYEYQNFIHQGNTYDFVVKSQEELNILVAYLNDNDTSNQTIEFKIDFDFGESCLDEISKAYQANELYGISYSYIDNQTSFMLIKK